SNSSSPFSWASVITSIDWYVEKITVIELGPDLASTPSRSWSVFVDAGKAKSFTVMSSSVRFPAFESEQTANVDNGTTASSAHARTAWESRLIDGTRNRTLPPAPTICSANRNDVNVFPVPQA